MISFKENPEETIKQVIQRFVAESPGNRMSQPDGEPYFEKPLVGFADANDPLFKEYKKIIGDFHLTPIEILAQSFPHYTASWAGASVISWILPISKSTRQSNRNETRAPSQAWEQTRIHGEAFNNQLREYVTSFIEKQQGIAVAPMLSEIFSVYQSEESGFCSNWSERHAAYAAGLGTFSLSRGLITHSGVAMRCGSVLTNLKLEPTTQPYKNYQEYCLSGTCGKCIDRCPAGAITQEGHNKDLCIMHIAELIQEGEDEYPGCGLCQTGVPCEAGIPKKRN
jgi:epoxyqueuosine reductase QueG